MEQKEKVRCLIIGSGPAGYTAAIYAARANLNPVIYCGLQTGGQLTQTTVVENFPGYPEGVDGNQMMLDFRTQAERFGTDIRDGVIVKADFSKAPYTLTTDNGDVVCADTVIIATGASAKYLGLSDEEKYKGEGVSACATCDGFFYRKKTVAVVGGGDTACEEALYLAGLAKKVYMIVRKPFLRASEVMQRRVKEAENLLNAGVKELVVIAQDVTAFGMDNESGENLTGLLRKLDELSGNFWIRLLYTHPAHYTDELVEFLSKSKHVLPYLDIPLQHISSRILREMGRKIDGDSTRRLLNKLRDSIPGVAIRTTFITGLPGETEVEYQELYDFVREFKFDRLGVFEYSAEPGTPAAVMSNQVAHEIAAARASAIMELQQQISLEHNRSLVGHKFQVIVDDKQGKKGIARAYFDAPEIDNYIEISSIRPLKEGRFYTVEITSADIYDLRGRVIL